MLRDGLYLALYCGLIFWLSSQPSLPSPELFSQQDKLAHMFAYAIMGWLAWRCFSHRLPKPLQLVVACIVFSSLYGAGDEWHQSFVPGRNADVQDWLADIVGATAAVLWLSSRLTRAAAAHNQPRGKNVQNNRCG